MVIDPVTGQEVKKKKLGGAYPGQVRPQHQPYQPPPSAFQNGQATAHFVTHGTGNALTLVQADGSHAPQQGKPAQFIQVTLPEGVYEGQTIHVQAPDGRKNEIVVPAGFGPGSTFTVEFADATTPAPPDTKIPVEQAAAMNDTRPPPTAAATAVPPSVAAPANDGFVAGFNNPNYRPPQQQYTQVHAVHTTTADPDIDLSAYPSSQATPVYK